MSSLIITLRRGLAGRKSTDLATLKALGFRKTGEVVERKNSADIRGQIAKVRHLIGVELKEDYAKRVQAEQQKAALREPLTLQHSPSASA